MVSLFDCNGTSLLTTAITKARVNSHTNSQVHILVSGRGYFDGLRSRLFLCSSAEAPVNAESLKELLTISLPFVPTILLTDVAGLLRASAVILDQHKRRTTQGNKTKILFTEFCGSLHSRLLAGQAPVHGYLLFATLVAAQELFL